MKKRGFTLIELIIVMAIFSIILLVVAQTLFSTGMVFNRTNDSANIQNKTLVVSRLISEDIKYSTDVTILTSKPITFDEDFNYIYEENNTIFLKVPNQGPRILSDTGNINQDVTFTKVNSKNIQFNLTLSKGNTSYETKSVIALLNLQGTDEVAGTTGSCITFKTGKLLVEEVYPDVISFAFLKSDNLNLSQDFISEEISVNGINIDTVNSRITVNSPIIIVSDRKNAYLIPKIIFKGDKFEVVVDSNKNVYDVNNGYPIDFYNNEVKFIVSNYSGIEREYTEDLDIKVLPTISRLSLEGNSSGVVEANDNSLEAKFDFGFAPDSYQVRWYVVNEREGLDLSKLYEDYIKGKYIPIAVVNDKNTIDVSSYLTSLEDKLIFFDVVPKVDNQEGNITVSISR